MQSPNERLLNQIEKLIAKQEALKEKIRLAKIRRIKQTRTFERDQYLRWQRAVKKALARFYPMPVNIIEEVVERAYSKLDISSLQATSDDSSMQSKADEINETEEVDEVEVEDEADEIEEADEKADESTSRN